MKQSIAKNFFYSAIMQIANILFPLLAFSHGSHIIGPVKLGMVNFASTVTGYFSLIGLFGIPTYGVREIARVRADQSHLRSTFNELFLINIFSIGASTVGFFIYTVKYSPSQEYFILYALNFIGLFLSLFSFDWLFQGLENYRYITIRSIIIKSSSTILIILLVKKQSDFLVFALLNILGLSVNNIFNLYYANKIVGIDFFGLNIRRHFPVVFKFALVSLITSFYLGMDKLMLGYLSGEYFVGLYVPADKISRLALGLIASMSAVIFPRISNVFSRGDESQISAIISNSIHISLLLSIPMFIVVEVLAFDLILMFSGEAYLAAVLTLRISSVIIPVVTLAQITGIQILIGSGKETKYLFSVIGGAVVFMVSGTLLIPKYDQNGAALSLVAAEFAGLCCQLFFSRKRITGVVSRAWLLPIMIASSAMAFLIFLLKNIIIYSTYRVYFIILIGGSAYLTILLFFKDSIVIRVREYILKIFKQLFFQDGL